MFALWSSPNHALIKSRGPNKETEALKETHRPQNLVSDLLHQKGICGYILQLWKKSYGWTHKKWVLGIVGIGCATR